MENFNIYSLSVGDRFNMKGKLIPRVLDFKFAWMVVLVV